MPHSELENLHRIGELAREPPSAQEIASYLKEAAEHLEHAKDKKMLPGPRFTLAYSASFALARAALRMAGYRTSNRTVTFQCLQYTLSLPKKDWLLLDQANHKRNLAVYEGHTDVPGSFVQALIEVVDELARRAAALQARALPNNGAPAQR